MKIVVKGPAGESNVSDRKKLDGIDCPIFTELGTLEVRNKKISNV
jgi:hypothetical protein